MYEPKESQSPTSDSKEASYTSLLFSRKLTVSDFAPQGSVSILTEQDESNNDAGLDKEIESPLDDVFEKEVKTPERKASEEPEAIPAIEVTTSVDPSTEGVKNLEKGRRDFRIILLVS